MSSSSSSTTATGTVQPTADPWQGKTKVDLYNHTANILYEFDAMCTQGGGVLLERDLPGRVFNGTASVQITLTAAQATTGLQVGYVLDRKPTGVESTQKGLTWLDPSVRDGTHTWTIPVPAGSNEAPGSDPLWNFYLRLNPAEAPQGCSTGLNAGTRTVIATAVKA